LNFNSLNKEYCQSIPHIEYWGYKIE